ncbi:sulfurtransferase [Brachybacterium paraconglomeratum]|uniref:sulfurtransferase n=1 Tax=Brachybacterium paraconglomeratum TaxID=173362 RepID=UPI0031EDA351
MKTVLNISAYLFTPITDREQLRPVLRARAEAAGLKGTILLAEEGINMFLAGDPDSVRGFVVELREDPRFAGLTTKESWSAEQPFRKLLVKLKREIIRMDHPTIRPLEERAPAVEPRTLKRWLDQGHDDAGREIVMLDTRNAFEVDYGTFAGAVDWRIERFTHFPEAASTHREALEGKTVVSFCTGGIRCEKAAIYLREDGIDALQLEGGILGYFEHVGQDHYDGECFVFDEREALAPDLSPRGGNAL